MKVINNVKSKMNVLDSVRRPDLSPSFQSRVIVWRDEPHPATLVIHGVRRIASGSTLTNLHLRHKSVEGGERGAITLINHGDQWRRRLACRTFDLASAHLQLKRVIVMWNVGVLSYQADASEKICWGFFWSIFPSPAFPRRPCTCETRPTLPPSSCGGLGSGWGYGRVLMDLELQFSICMSLAVSWK